MDVIGYSIKLKRLYNGFKYWGIGIDEVNLKKQKLMKTPLYPVYDDEQICKDIARQLFLEKAEHFFNEDIEKIDFIIDARR